MQDLEAKARIWRQKGRIVPEMVWGSGIAGPPLLYSETVNDGRRWIGPHTLGNGP